MVEDGVMRTGPQYKHELNNNMDKYDYKPNNKWKDDAPENYVPVTNPLF